MLKIFKAIPLIRSSVIRNLSVSVSVWKEINMVDMPDNSLPIPKYKQKENETSDVKKARLLYQSRKRGMLENCLLLSTFAARYLNTMSDKQLDLYDNLINQPTNDWDIYYYATNVKPIPSEYDNEIMDMLKKHACNEEKEQRLTQPDLYEKI